MTRNDYNFVYANLSEQSNRLHIQVSKRISDRVVTYLHKNIGGETLCQVKVETEWKFM